MKQQKDMKVKNKNRCPECFKSYARVPKRCMCGWYFTNDNSVKLDRTRCHYIENGVQCQNPGTRAIGRWGKEWFCSDHEQKLREQEYKY